MSAVDAKALFARVADFLVSHPCNYISAEDAMREDLIGLQMYDAPIFAVGAADDPLFEALRAPEAVHPDYALPEDFVPGARSVISFFAPFTGQVKEANAQDMKHPADEWLHARFEGDALLRLVRKFLVEELAQAGYTAVAPFLDTRYRKLADYAVNWSERHTGFVCGLGTFGMSKGLITEKGVAGRLGSVVTDCPLPVTPRTYTGVYDHCSRCGQCMRNCPVHCIDPARGMDHAKAHPPCSRLLDAIDARPPRGRSGKKRYGCGKCQVATPCQDGIPKK